jgi:hypothetical protein
MNTQRPSAPMNRGLVMLGLLAVGLYTASEVLDHSKRTESRAPGHPEHPRREPQAFSDEYMAIVEALTAPDPEDEETSDEAARPGAAALASSGFKAPRLAFTSSKRRLIFQA